MMIFFASGLMELEKQSEPGAIQVKSKKAKVKCRPTFYFCLLTWRSHPVATAPGSDKSLNNDIVLRHYKIVELEKAALRLLLKEGTEQEKIWYQFKDYTK